MQPRVWPARALFHLAVHVRSGFEGLLIALPAEPWPGLGESGTAGLAERLMRLARHIDPKRVAASKRGPERRGPKGYVDGGTPRAHVATARVVAEVKTAS